MRILVLQDYLRSGGTERQSVALARAFAAEGHETQVLTFRPGGALAPTVPGNGVRLRALQPVDLRLDWFAPGLFPAVRDFRPDVVLAMGRLANSYGGFVAEELRRQGSRAAVVGTVRTGKPLPFLYRRSLRRAAAVVANSRHAANTLVAQAGVPAERRIVVHNALLFPPSEARPAPRPPGRPLTLLCVAMFRPEKAHAWLLETVATLPRVPAWNLLLVGEGPERARCQKLAARLGLADRVEFAGFVRDPSPVYARADLALLASRRESLPNFLVEAQAHGLPVVACDTGGVSECFVPERSGFLVTPGDRAGFVARLTELLTQEARRESFSQYARAFARDAFSPERQPRAYLELFERLVAVRR